MYNVSLYFNDFLIGSYNGTQNQIESAIIADNAENTFFNRKYTKNNNCLISKDNYTTVVIERL